MPVKLQIAVSRASLKFLWGWTGAVVRVDGVSPSVFRCTSTSATRYRSEMEMQVS